MVGGGAERGGTGMGMTGPIRVGEAHASLWSRASRRGHRRRGLGSLQCRCSRVAAARCSHALLHALAQGPATARDAGSPFSRDTSDGDRRSGPCIGLRFAAALLPRLFETNPTSPHKGATGRVRTGNQRLQVRRATPAPPSSRDRVTETDAVGHATGSVEEVATGEAGRARRGERVGSDAGGAEMRGGPAPKRRYGQRVGGRGAARDG